MIDAQGIAHLVEETSDRVGTDEDTEATQRQGDLVGGPPGPLQPSDRIAGRVVFEQLLICAMMSAFFFHGRAAPTRPSDTSGGECLDRGVAADRGPRCADRRRETRPNCASPPCPSRSDSSPAYSRRCCSETHAARADQRFGAGARVADHDGADHHESGEHHVEETIAASVEDQ